MDLFTILIRPRPFSKNSLLFLPSLLNFYFLPFWGKTDISSFLSLKLLSICSQPNNLQNIAPITISILHTITHHLYLRYQIFPTLCSGLWNIMGYYDEVLSVYMVLTVCERILANKAIIKLHKKKKPKIKVWKECSGK